MTILLAETSVVADIEKAGLIDPVLCLPHDFAVVDALHDAEIKPHAGAVAFAGRLRVETLSEEELAHAVEIRRACRGLAVPDALALSLAETRAWVLIATCRLIVTEAQRRRITCRGTLWLFDLLEEAGFCLKRLRCGVEGLAADPRCRLPRPAMNQRLSRYLARTMT